MSDFFLEKSVCFLHYQLFFFEAQDMDSVN